MGGATQQCPQNPDPCKELLQQILEFIANIQKRYWDLKNDTGNLPATKPDQPDPRYGTRSIQGEQQQYQGRQTGLRNRLKDWDSNHCGPPPAQAWDWATKPVPAADPKPENNTARNAAAAGATVGAGYLIYRGIRMIPSLFPPLWWTIPENAAIP